ncbi:hypothetical protein [Polaribacter batillariae]|uniref:hypothetical protein n=1 Tax=Polaribacter batillariae TaxID=2808900 RepID=UPI001FB10CCC|nr:hypothetical protein [Polaribacter batillariae]
MNQKIKFTFLTLCCLITVPFFGQLDKVNGGKTNEKGTSITLKNKKTSVKPTSIELKGDLGFKKAYEIEQKKLQQQQDKEKLLNKGILTEKKLTEARFLKAFKKIKGRYIYPKIDQDLGSIRTNSNSVNIICRDYQYPDGDRVTILVDGIPVVTNIVLKQRYQSFNIPLKVGINKITILALNQGTSGPNTAAFKVYNDAGMLLSSNEWNLATGAKATLLVAKDK